MARPKRVMEKMLSSATEIQEYLCISPVLFAHFVKLDMPAVRINGRWYAHCDNIDDWWKRKTAKPGVLDVPE